MSHTTIKLTPYFERQAKKLMTSKSLEALYDYLEKEPKKGVVIPGAGGIRKLRWRTGRGGKGKSSGVRVLYYCSKEMLIILITLYSKSKKENITVAERNELKQLLPKLIDKYSEDT